MRRFLMSFVLLTAISTANAGVKQCRILQSVGDRMYFPAGQEENIYPHAGFVVLAKTDTVLIGEIEYAGPAISYSYPLGELDDSLELSSLSAQIETAEIDSLHTFTIGTTGYMPRHRRDKGDTGSMVDSTNGTTLNTALGSRVQLVVYSSPLAMQLDLDAGRIDGCFSYKRVDSPSDACQTAVSRAPCYCALVPGVSVNAQRNALLSTAVYYRFNEEKFDVIFDGDGVSALNCLRASSQESPRHYAYDPPRGRMLGKEVTRNTRAVTMAVEDHSLDKAALFFSDILSRDRIRTTMVDISKHPDLRLLFVPVSDESGSYSLHYVYEQLISDTTAGQSVNETIRIIGKYLELADSAKDSTLADRYLGIAEKSLAEDIGVLPLFRPTLYFTAEPDIKGGSFSSSGEFDITRLVRIRLPSPASGASQ